MEANVRLVIDFDKIARKFGCKINNHKLAKFLVAKCVSCVLDDTFENYTQSQARTLDFRFNDGWTIGYRHDGRTETTDIVIEKGDNLRSVTGDIKADRESLYRRAIKMVEDVLNGTEEDMING